MMNRGLVPLPRLGLRLLRAPAQRPHDFPDMAGVVADTGDPFDRHRDARQAPEIGVEPVGPRALEQGFLHPLELFGEELRLAPGPAGGVERRAATSLPPVKPVLGRLPGDPQPAGDFGLGQILGKEGRGFQASLFQTSEVPPGPIPLVFLAFHTYSISME